MSQALPLFVQACGHGVYAVDTGFVRPHFDAAYLMVHAGRAAIIDTGPAPGVPRILGALKALGVGLDAVDYVIPTHVHLDHAGGAGQLMQACPRASLLVHPRGQRHMVDPTALWAGATEVYGPEEMARAYGQVLPIASERTQVTHDGQRVRLAGRELLFADTPGHARHHHCIWDATSQGWFTGDTFGLSYREFDTAAGPWMLPTSTPVQFEPDVLRASIQRLLDQGPQRIYLTHFGCVQDAMRLGRQLMATLDEMTAMARGLAAGEGRHQALKRGQLDVFMRGLRAHGSTLTEAQVAALLQVDLELNAQGMAIWLDRR
ncbi:MAG TPA: MBL fold metallo-hydrolase [Rubrivivax sp.]|nr:MBL fold metallo-hydrolase [Rubrivivax sp.]